MAPSRSRVWQWHSASRLKRFLIILAGGYWPVISSRKASLGKSSYRTNRSTDFVLVYDTPSVPRRRHHESVGSGKILPHSPGPGACSDIRQRPARDSSEPFILFSLRG